MLRMYRKGISILSIISFTIFLMFLNIVSSSFGPELVQKTTGQSDVQKDYSFIRKWGSYGTGDGQFNLPISLIIDSKGNIIVNDRGNSHIQKFDTNGKLLLNFGATGTDDGQFSEMEHIAVDKFDNIYVNDPQSGPSGSGNPRIQKFDTNGNFITKWGSYGSGDGQFVDPEHLTVDSEGNVYVSDRHNNNIQVFAPVNNLLQD